MDQPLLPVSYNLQTWRRCTLCHHSVVNDAVKQYWPQYQPLGYTIKDKSPGRGHVTDHNPLSLAGWAVLRPDHKVHLLSLCVSVSLWRSFERQCHSRFEIHNILLLLFYYFSVLSLIDKNIWDATGENVIRYLKLGCKSFRRFAHFNSRQCFGIVQIGLLVCNKFPWLQQMKNIALVIENKGCQGHGPDYRMLFNGSFLMC